MCCSVCLCSVFLFFFFKQKTAYEMRISDWSSDVCSSDLRMLTFDSVKLRLDREQPMTFLDFNYMILQGYDFRHLSKAMGVRLPMGGSDQCGNIVNGVALGRRMVGPELYCVPPPLLPPAPVAKLCPTAARPSWPDAAQPSLFHSSEALTFWKR